MIRLNHYDGYILQIDYTHTENGIRTPPNFQRSLNSLASDNPLKYVRLALSSEIQIWVNAEDSLNII